MSVSTVETVEQQRKEKHRGDGIRPAIKLGSSNLLQVAAGMWEGGEVMRNGSRVGGGSAVSHRSPAWLFGCSQSLRITEKNPCSWCRTVQ